MNTCIYVSSFKSRSGSFGDYSNAFLRVLDLCFTEVLSCDIEPWVDCNNGFAIFNELNLLARDFKRRSDQVDIIYLEGVQFHAVAWYMARTLKKLYPEAKIIATIHDSPYPFYRSILSLYPLKILNLWKWARLIDKSPIGHRLQRDSIDLLDGVICLSEAGLNAFTSKWPYSGKTGVIPHVLLSEDQTNRPTPVGTNLFTIYYTGSWWKHKGVEILIEATKLLKTQYKTPAKLVLSGGCKDNAYRRQINHLVDDLRVHQEVECPGFETFEEIKDSSKNTHIWVVPYSYSSKVACSGIMNLAISYGSCVVCSDLPQFSEIIEDKKNGRLFEAQNAESLAKVLAELACDQEDIQSYKHNLWIKAKNEMSTYKVFQVLEKVLLQTVIG